MNRIALVLTLVLALLVPGACKSGPDTKDEKLPVETDTVTDAGGPSAQELFVAGNEQLDAGQWEEAVATYDRALAQDDQRWDIHLNKAIALSQLQRFEEAVTAIEAALNAGGDQQAAVYFNLGNIYQKRGLYAQSVRAYRHALALPKVNQVDALVNLAAAYVYIMEFDKAEQTYERVRQLDPDEPRAMLGLALVEHRRGNYVEALRRYESINASAPDYARAYFHKGRLLTKMKRVPEAVESYRRYLALAPEGPRAHEAQQSIDILQNQPAEPNQ